MLAFINYNVVNEEENINYQFILEGTYDDINKVKELLEELKSDSSKRFISYLGIEDYIANKGFNIERIYYDINI